EWKRRQRADGAADHPGAGPQLGSTAHDDVSTLQLQAGEISPQAAAGDDPSFHPHPDFEASRAFDADGPARHPGETSAVGRSDLSAGVPADLDESPRHLGTEPVRGVSRDLDCASLHVRPEVHARVADESDAAASHAAADPFDPSRIAADLELVAGRPLD